MDRIVPLSEFWGITLPPYLDPVTRAQVRGLSRYHRDADPDYVFPWWMGRLWKRWRWLPVFDVLWLELVSFSRIQRDRMGPPGEYYLHDAPTPSTERVADCDVFNLRWRIGGEYFTLATSPTVFWHTNAVTRSIEEARELLVSALAPAAELVSIGHF